MENESRHPELVTHPNPLTWSNLVLPLGRHDLSIDARDVDAGKVAGLQMRLHDVASNGRAGASRAVVWALGAREPALGPAQGPLGRGV